MTSGLPAMASAVLNRVPGQGSEKITLDVARDYRFSGRISFRHARKRECLF